MSTLTLSQPFLLSPFQPGEKTEIDPDTFRLARPTVVKLNDLYMYGNLCLLREQRFSVSSSSQLIRRMSAKPILFETLSSGKVLVTPLYKPIHEEIAAIPLRWGCPRIVVLHAGFKHFLGPRIDEEISPLCRKWRYEFDPFSDLVVSLWHPDDDQAQKKCRIEIVDDLVDRLAHCEADRILRGTIQLFPSFTE